MAPREGNTGKLPRDIDIISLLSKEMKTIEDHKRKARKEKADTTPETFEEKLQRYQKENVHMNVTNVEVSVNRKGIKGTKKTDVAAGSVLVPVAKDGLLNVLVYASNQKKSKAGVKLTLEHMGMTAAEVKKIVSGLKLNLRGTERKTAPTKSGTRATGKAAAKKATGKSKTTKKGRTSKSIPGEA